MKSSGIDAAMETFKFVNDMDDASVRDEEVEDSELTSETSLVKMLRRRFEEFISNFASNSELKAQYNEPYWPFLKNLTLWGYEGSFYKLMRLMCKNAPNLISLNLNNSDIYDEFPDPPELSQVVQFPEKLQKLTAQIDVFHDYECEYHSNIQIMHITNVDPLYAYEEDSSGNFEEIFTHPRDVEKLARKLAKSSVKFLELDYVIFQLNEELEEVNVEMIYQILSAVECLLIKCRSDPNFMSPTLVQRLLKRNRGIRNLSKSTTG